MWPCLPQGGVLPVAHASRDCIPPTVTRTWHMLVLYSTGNPLGCGGGGGGGANVCACMCGGDGGVVNSSDQDAYHPAMCLSSTLCNWSLTLPLSSPAAERPRNVARFILDEHNNVHLVNQR